MTHQKDVIVPVPPEIREYAKSRGIPITQLNGQRFYGPSYYLSGACQQEQPVDMTEVYVGRIPKNLLEPDLVPFLEAAVGGPFYQLRLMMNFSGYNRGYCFVTYFDQQQAEAAIVYLNGLKFPKDSMNRLVAHRSINNKRLILGGIPNYKTLPEIYQEVNHYYPGVIAIHKTQHTNPDVAKCLIFVDYQDHRAAIKARSKMLSEKCHLWGFKIAVDWAQPEGVHLPHKRKNGPIALQVENVSQRTVITQLKVLFNQESSNGVQRISRMRKRAIVYFATRAQAETAKLMTNETILDGNQIYVDWCHPFVLESDIRRRRAVRQRRNKNRRYRRQFEMMQRPMQPN